MSKKKRFSFFSKLFKRNETPYPAALDGHVTPWITISNKNSHPLKKNRASQKTILRVTDFKTKQKNTHSHQNIKLSSLDIQLKKMRLFLILKNNKPLKKIDVLTVKTPPPTAFTLNQEGVILRHKTKI